MPIPLAAWLATMVGAAASQKMRQSAEESKAKTAKAIRVGNRSADRLYRLGQSAADKGEYEDVRDLIPSLNKYYDKEIGTGLLEEAKSNRSGKEVREMVQQLILGDGSAAEPTGEISPQPVQKRPQADLMKQGEPVFDAPTLDAAPAEGINLESMSDFIRRAKFTYSTATGDVTLSGTLGPPKRTLSDIEYEAMDMFARKYPEAFKQIMEDWVRNEYQGTPTYETVTNKEEGTQRIDVYRAGKRTVKGVEEKVAPTPEQEIEQAGKRREATEKAAAKVAKETLPERVDEAKQIAQAQQEVEKTEAERSYDSYSKVRTSRGQESASFELYTSAHRNIERVIDDFSPQPGFMGAVEKLNLEQRDKKAQAWGQYRMMIELYGLYDSMTLKFMSGRILTNLGYSAQDQTILEQQYQQQLAENWKPPTTEAQ